MVTAYPGADRVGVRSQQLMLARVGMSGLNVRSESKPKRLTDSMGPDIAGNSFVEPEYVHFPGAEGKQVPGWLFLPKNLDRSKKHPAVVWIHGDGVNQNYDGLFESL